LTETRVSVYARYLLDTYSRRGMCKEEGKALYRSLQAKALREGTNFAELKIEELHGNIVGKKKKRDTKDGEKLKRVGGPGQVQRGEAGGP